MGYRLHEVTSKGDKSYGCIGLADRETDFAYLLDKLGIEVYNQKWDGAFFSVHSSDIERGIKVVKGWSEDEVREIFPLDSSGLLDEVTKSDVIWYMEMILVLFGNKRRTKHGNIYLCWL